MKFLSVIFLIYALNNAGASDIKAEEGVLVLTSDNFQSAISDNEFILVEFYAPWCGHCKALAPEYAKAAQQLAEKESAIKLGKVDATEEQDLAEKHGVKGYPTLIFFRNGSPVDYSGGRSADEIVTWLIKKTGPPALNLAAVEEAKLFIESNNVAVVGFFKDQTSDDAKKFLNVAATTDDQQFAITSEDSVFGEYEAQDGNVILFKKFDEGKVLFEGELAEQNLKKFIVSNALPLVVEFNHETAQKIFGGDIKSHLLLFLAKGEDHFETISEAARSVAKPFKEQVLFVTIDANEEDHQRIFEFFGMKRDEIPAARLIKLEDDMAKYKPEMTELTADNLKQFVQDYLDGKLKQHLLSQDLPEDWDKTPVKTLVVSNFEQIAMDKDKDVLVEFYAPWCGHCKQLVPIYEKVAEHFEKDDNIVIAKIDATANELEHTKITSFPTLKLYRKDDNLAIQYNGPRTYEGITKFVESRGVESDDIKEAEEETEDDDTLKKDEL
ncbi:Thioredoxin [Popillia japonica]|uniref:Protein disulfide-isomerase n=1 Tax=Popillia japonica TaxID=7064 RepID=A0AAW1KKF6_POPJA